MAIKNPNKFITINVERSQKYHFSKKNKESNLKVYELDNVS